MGGIFPPAGNGGTRPGPNICNGYTPEHSVIGEGPLYVAPDCTTVLTDCTFNAIVSELLAAVDHLGFPFNAARVDNLATALTSTFDDVNRRIDTKVNRDGDTMLGALNLYRDPEGAMEATNKRYVDNQNAALNTALRAYADSLAAAITAAWQAANAAMDEKKVNRSGDTMTGQLTLPANMNPGPLDAVTREYVDSMSHLEEAPMDGQMYGRAMGAWVPILLDDGEY